jgi:hypothetical protein
MRSLVVVLALLLAACSSGGHHAATRPTITTVPLTVRPTTTTTTPTNVTESALVGSWRPVSIVGYHGPLTPPKLVEVPVLRFDGKGVWTGSDGCHNWGGPYRLGAGGTFHLSYNKLVLRDCGPNVGRPIDAAVRVDLQNGRLTFFARNGEELAQYERATVTARVVLPSTTMTAGSSMSGHVIVENNTGSALHERGCGPYFKVALGNDKIQPVVQWPQSLCPMAIPTGRSSYPVTVSASYLVCSEGQHLAGNPGSEPCLLNPPRPPPLPPGEYEATLVQSSTIVPTPPPIAVRVTAQP